MAVTLPSGFIITNNEPIDSRLIMTKAQMKAAKIAKTPSPYLCVCSEDHRIYIFDAANTADATIGRFRPLEEYLTFSSDAAKAKFEAALEGSTKFTTLETKVGDADLGTGIAGDVKVLQTNVTALQTDVNVLKPEVAQLKLEVEDPDSGLAKRVQALSDKMDDLEPRVAQAELDLAELEERFQNLKISDLPGTLDGGTVTL